MVICSIRDNFVYVDGITRAAGHQLTVPICKKESTRASFSFRVIRYFNALPVAVQQIASLPSFKNALYSDNVKEILFGFLKGTSVRR